MGQSRFTPNVGADVMRTTSNLLANVLRQRQQDGDAEEHTPEYLALLHALQGSAHAFVVALKSDTTDRASLRRVVTHYIARATNAGICRTRVRDAIELLVHDHGGPRWFGEATAIASLAMRGPTGSVAGVPRGSRHNGSLAPC
jgi:hypothetical protein